ncbi:unnamed protein product [Closterium sp. NIES-54]
MAFTASTMANPITPLRLEADGSSSHFKAWSYGVDKHLLSRDVQGLDLKDVHLNHGKGKQPLLPREPTESATEADTRAYEEAVEKYRKWEKADAAIISVFITSTPPELVNTFHNYPTSNAIWKYLQDRFMFQVRLEDCLGMADYIAKVQTIHGELKELGIVFPKQAPAAALLVGLTTAYEITRKMLLTLTAEELTFAKVSTALLSAEKDSTAQAKAYAIRAPMPQASVAAAPASASFQRNRFPPCTYVVKYGNHKGQVCGGTNHPLATCFKKKDDEWYAIHGIDKRPPNWMRARKTNMVEVQDPASASASDIAPADVRINLLFPSTAMINEASSQYLGSSQAPQYIEFTLDSGATHTVLKETLSFKPYATPIPLLGADSSFTTLAKGSSTVSCPAFPSGTVTGMCMPSLRHNLVAQTKIKKAGLRTIFWENENYGDILGPLTNKVLTRFTLNSSGLYMLQVPILQVSTTQAEATTSPCSCRSFSNPTILYHRLGHPNFRTLADMASKKLLLGLPASLPPPPDSPACALIAPRANCVNSPTRPHPLSQQHHWTWYTWTSGALPLFPHEAQTTFDRKVKRLHSDGGGEFCNDRLKAFCSSEGIQQNFTLPDSPQRNGIAESRNHTLVQITRCLLSHSNAPHSLWVTPPAPPSSPVAHGTRSHGPAPPLALAIRCSTITSTPPAGGDVPSTLLEDRHEELYDLHAVIPQLSHIFPNITESPSLNFMENPTIPIPLTVQEALSGSHAAEWRAAMEAEIEAFTHNHSFDDETPPPGVNIVGGKWLFRVKQLPNEAPVFKARYVAKGFTQQQYRDFFLTFSPTSKPPTICMLMDVAAREEFEIKSMDASSAFLQGRLKETVFMDRPDGFPGEFPPNTVWKLNRPVYGLKQAPREWHNKVKEVLLSLDFHPSSADPTLFTCRHSEPFYILVYVDDFILVAKDSAQMTSVQAALSKALQMKDLGDLKHYLGMEITRDRQARTISLS